VEVPDGALYIIIGQTTSSSGSDYTPSSARFLTQKGYDEELSLLNANDVNIPVDFSKQESLLGFVQTDGTWLKNDDGSAHYKIPVIGDSVTIESGESGGTYDSSFVFASDAEGIYWTVLTGQTRVVQQVSNAITYNIPEGARYLIVNKASSSSSTRDLTPRSVVFHKSSREIIEENAIEQSGSPYTANKWRVMIYNIGHLNGGGASSQSSITDSNYDSKKFNLGELFDTFGTNIVGLAEYPLLFAPQSSHPDETTKDALFQKYWTSFIAPRRTDVTDLGYNALMARVPFENLESVHYQGEGLIRYYIKGYWNLLGIKVKFITSHLQYNTADKTDLTYQYAQIQEMLDDCANDSHAIIMGDLNTPAEDVVSYLTTGGYVDSGWKICNGSVYGTYNTYRNNDGIRGSKTLDNILIKGFDVEKVYMVVSSQSDHNALLTDIRVIV
jgi:endonuclease/exonuclease/phosphatase family metal-dependent hydrolase